MFNLIVFHDYVVTKSYLPVNEDYIPVFEDIDECHNMVDGLTREHKDDSFITCVFDNLADVEQRMSEEFNRPVKLVVRERR